MGPSRVRLPSETAGANSPVSLPRGDSRGFVHKRIFGGLKGALGGLLSGPLGIISGGIGGILRPTPTTFAVPPFVPSPAPIPGRVGGCPPGFTRRGTQCIQSHRAGDPHPFGAGPVPGLPGMFHQTQPNGFAPSSPVTSVVSAAQAADGEARLGRFGAALEPTMFTSTTLRCPPGSILGKEEQDGSFLCYNRRDLSNKERKWPRGRRPLLTGGDMRCISVASSAAKKLERKQKQLQELGFLKKPTRRAVPRLAPGHEAVVRHG